MVSMALGNERKQELCSVMASNLSTLREKAKITQEELAVRLGFSRQTISAIENKKREMKWNVFTSISLFLSKDYSVYQLMEVMGILDDDICDALNIMKYS